MSVTLTSKADMPWMLARLASPARTIAVGVAVLAVVIHRAWWSLVFVVFAFAMVVIERPASRRFGLVWMAVAIAGSAGLVLLGLYLQSLAGMPDDYGCTLLIEQFTRITPKPCPGLTPYLQLGGVAAAITGALGLGGCLWYMRRSGTGLFLPTLNLILFGLFGIAVLFGADWGNAIVEIAALTAATRALTLTLDGPPLLRAAVIAQIADLGTFGPVWQLGAGEQNPLGRWTMDALFAGGSGNGIWSWGAAAATGVILILAKLGLIGFLIEATPFLGRYRRTVLLSAALVGTVGATANALTIWL
jgi:hypothetical protein